MNHCSRCGKFEPSLEATGPLGQLELLCKGCTTSKKDFDREQFERKCIEEATNLALDEVENDTN